MAVNEEITQRYVEDYPLDSIKPHPKNPKQHDDEWMDESLEVTGFTGTIQVHATTDHCLDGHGRVAGLRRAGRTTAPVMLVTCTDSMAEKILLNRNVDKGGFFDEKLAEILAQKAEEGDLLGTGYDVDAVDDLLAGIPHLSTLPPAEFDGDYVETPEQKDTRGKRKAVTQASVGLREFVLVYKDEDYDRVRAAINVVGNFHECVSSSEAVKAGMLNYAKQIVSDGEVDDGEATRDSGVPSEV